MAAPRNSFITYQLQRAHALGTLSDDAVAHLAATASSARDMHWAAATLAETLAAEGRTIDAVGAARLAEFFADRPSAMQERAYRRYLDLWNAAFGGQVTRLEVPYEGGALPAVRYRAAGDARATVVGFGGFDSLIEEFHPIWRGIAAAGFDVVAFDGPGQGGARTLHGLVHTHDWERPIAAVLDHAGLEHAALVGMSMGGYWAVRAAAYESRVAALVSWPPVYDWLARFPRPVAASVRRMATWRRFMNWSVRLRTRAFPVLDHIVRQALWVSGGHEPADAVNWFLGMNAAHVGSHRVQVPALLVMGERDRFQPAILGRLQAAALTSAPVTTRIFTAAEGAADHCQMGNLPLAVSAVSSWLQRRFPLPGAGRRDPTGARA